MQYDATTPEAYLGLLENDWRRERLVAIRDVFLGLKGIEEGIGHGMLQYRRNGEVFAYLNAQKGYVGVYLGDLERIDPGAAIRGTMNCGKSCVRVRKRDDLGVVEELIGRKAEMVVE